MPTPKRRHANLKGRRMLQIGGRTRRIVQPKPQVSVLLGSSDAIRPIQLPPLSSPEDRPRRKVSGTKPPTIATCIPQEEEACGRSNRFTGRYPPKLTPERLLKDSSEANNPQTRKGAYRRKTIGLQFPSPSKGAVGMPTAC
jgi:hypothetical protein